MTKNPLPQRSETPRGTRPASLAPELFKRRVFSGNPPHAPYRYGWLVRLGGPSTVAERAWLHAHGYVFGGGKWARPDRRAEELTLDDPT